MQCKICTNFVTHSSTGLYASKKKEDILRQILNYFKNHLLISQINSIKQQIYFSGRTGCSKTEKQSTHLSPITTLYTILYLKIAQKDH